MSNAAQQRAYLQAMGIQPWVRREIDPAERESAAALVAAADLPTEDAAAARVTEAVVDLAGDETVAKEAVPQVSGNAVSVSSSSVVNENPRSVDDSEQRLELLSDLPEPAIVEPLLTEPSLSEPSLPPASLTPPPVAAESTVALLDWDGLQAAVRQCAACGLQTTRTQTVFGSGNRAAEWMIVGEAPGEDEDQQGEPFVGASGQLLSNMLRATGLSREQVYITNVIKCHPPKDRNPHVDELGQCFDYLQQQIALVQPRLILAVGRVAAHALLKVNSPLGELRGQVHQFANTPLVVTYHPAYLLRKPFEKAKSWDDLRLARRVVAGAPS